MKMSREQVPHSRKMPREEHPESHLFTLRVWQEALGEGKVEWRGRVQDIVTGETLFFRDWPGLVATLLRIMAKTAPPPEECNAKPTSKVQNDA